MKKLLGILVLGLFLITPSQADDIRDFQIEGMSVGDSLLDYFSKNKINGIKRLYYPKSKKFYSIRFYSSKFEIYESIQVHLKENDKKYKIYSIQGFELYANDIKACLRKKDQLSKELSEVFGISDPYIVPKKKHVADLSGQSFTYKTIFNLDNGHALVSCYDWSKKLTQEKGWDDNLKVIIDTKEFAKWLNNEAY